MINGTPHVFWASGRQAARPRWYLGTAAPGRCRNCSAPGLPPSGGRARLAPVPREAAHGAAAQWAPLLRARESLTVAVRQKDG